MRILVAPHYWQHLELSVFLIYHYSTCVPTSHCHIFLITQRVGHDWVTELNGTVMVFAIHRHELAMGVHVFPHPEPPPLSLSTASLWIVPEHWLWVSCFIHRTCIGHLFYIWVIYIFQRFSFKSSHLCVLPHSPKICSLHLCLLCCPAYGIVGTIFLNSINMC